MTVAILGVTGYAGTQLLKILAAHPEITDILAVSSSRSGVSILEEIPELHPDLVADKMKKTAGKIIDLEKAATSTPEVVFSALPHLKSAEVLKPFYYKSLVLDLSADFRMKNKEKFKIAYGSEPLYPELQSQSVYGLCEWYEKEIAGCNLIAVPGCYPTATLLPLLPLLKENLLQGDIIINALSGISGAGKKAQNHLLFCERQENMTAYLPGMSHRHAYEISEQLEAKGLQGQISFTPHLIPLRRGIFVTSAVNLKSGINTGHIRAAFEQYYQDRKCIKLLTGVIPQTNQVWGTNRCDIGYHREGERLLLFSAIDNLIKGAAGQAVQCMNIRLGYPEVTGLPLVSPF